MNINITKASKILGVTRPTIYAMQERGELPDPISVMSIMEYIQKRQGELTGIQDRLGAYMQTESANDKLAVGD